MAIGDLLNRSAVLGARTFEDAFDLGHLDTSKWDSHWWYGAPGGVDPSSRLFGNGDMAIQSDPAYNGVQPFTLPSEQLHIHVAPNAKPSDPNSGGKPFTTGCLNNRKLGGQAFGYFEAHVYCPAVTGIWPAFWLLGVDPAHKDMEIDVFEAIGSDPHNVYLSTHEVYQDGRTPINVTTAHSLEWGAYSHTWGVLVTPTMLVFYLDGLEIQRESNVGRFDFPLYSVIDVTVGPAGWNNNVPAAGWKGGSAVFYYVRHYALAAGVQ